MEPTESSEKPTGRPWYAAPDAVSEPPTSLWPGLPSAPPSAPVSSVAGSFAGPPPSWPPAVSATAPNPDAPSTRRRSRVGRRILAGCAAAVLVVAGGFAGGLVGSRLIDDGAPTASSIVARTVADRTTASTSASTIDATAVLRELRNSVVAIQAEVTSYDGPWASRGEADGTGIVIDDSGDILTNAHVVANAMALTVTLPGSTTPREATLVGADAQNDVAVIRVADATGLVAADLATTDRVEVGEGVVAIGNALALQGSLTVTQGIVSAVDRSIRTDESSSLGGLLQTDAAISSGNSGGPLVDADGTVIAMNTAVASSNGQVQASNIGFAIPIRTALDRASAWLHNA